MSCWIRPRLRAGGRRFCQRWEVATANNVESFGLQVFLHSSTAETPKLAVDVAAVCVDSGRYGLPGVDHGLLVQAWHVGVARGLRGDKGCFCDEEGARGGPALGVVLLDEGQRDVVVIFSMPKF